MKKKKGCLIGCLTFIIILPILYVVTVQRRDFHTVGDMTFTFWKTPRGCYITPYKYWGLTVPRNNYMIAENLGGAIILIAEDSMLYIFPIQTHIRGTDTITVNLSSYKYKYFPFINEASQVRTFQDTIDYYKNRGYPYIHIYIDEMYARIGNSPNAEN